MRFVVQEHHARTHHFDFRLEKDGVYKSWAVPKGLPHRPGIRRLAIQVADHDLAFGSFEGTIADGEYGAGQVRIWDQGDYVCQEWSDEKIRVDLEGQKLKGEYSLIRTRHIGEHHWLIQKLRSVRETSR